jgi:hypothetical protein
VSPHCRGFWARFDLPSRRAPFPLFFELPGHAAPMPELQDHASFLEVMEADQYPAGKVSRQLSVLRLQAFVFHSLYGHVLGPDGAFLPHHVAATARNFVTAKIGTADRHPALGRDIGTFNVIEPENRQGR